MIDRYSEARMQAIKALEDLLSVLDKEIAMDERKQAERAERARRKWRIADPFSFAAGVFFAMLAVALVVLNWVLYDYPSALLNGVGGAIVAAAAGLSLGLSDR